MKRFFKMVVFSLSFLIIGGIFAACNKTTEETTTEVTTEVSSEIATEQTEEDYDTIEGYKVSIPEGYEFKGINEGMQMYQKGTDYSLFISVDDAFDSIVDIDKAKMYDIMVSNTPQEAKELAYNYDSTKDYVTGVYSYQIDSMSSYFVSFVLYDNIKHKMIMINYMTVVNENNKDILNDELTMQFQSLEDFIDNNF